MIKVKDIKENLCIVPHDFLNSDNKILEGIITKVYDSFNYAVVLYLSYENKKLSLTESRFPFDKLKFWNASYNPKFCKAENLYDVLKKHSQNGILNMIGFSKDVMYFVTKNHDCLEVINCSDGFVWMNNTGSINDLHFETKADYVHLGVDVTFKENLRDTSDISITFTAYHQCDVVTFYANKGNKKTTGMGTGVNYVAFREYFMDFNLEDSVLKCS